MGGQIGITPSVMRQRAGQYQSEAEELINEIAAALESVATQLEQTGASSANAFRG